MRRMKAAAICIQAFNDRYPKVEALMYSTRLFFRARSRAKGRACLEDLSRELCERLERMSGQGTH
jgi:hypothetical protein